MYNKLDDSWSEAQVVKLHSDVVTEFMRCDSDHGVDAAVEYASFLNFKGLDNQNFPVFLDLLQHKNERVIDALLGDGKVFYYFRKLQRTSYFVSACFELLNRFTPGDVYVRTLETILGVLYQNYRNAAVGYRLYPPSFKELNNMGKFLTKNRLQSEKINRIILDILADLGELSSKDVKGHQVDQIGAHANRIRNAFLDNRAVLEEAIPASVLTRGDG